MTVVTAAAVINSTAGVRITHLIKEQYAWRTSPCTAEYCANCQFAFPNIFIEKFRALEVKIVRKLTHPKH